MGPLPYPHRATFLASTLDLPAGDADTAAMLARLLSVLVFDHLVRHPIVTLGDHDDERLVDDGGALLDASHPLAEESLDWFFRVSRRHEVLWFALSCDPARPAPPTLHARRPDGTVAAWTARTTPPGASLAAQLTSCIAAWLAARRLPAVSALADFTLDDLRAAAGRLGEAERQLARVRTLARLPGALRMPPPRLGVPYLRVLAELARDEARALDGAILELEPTHPVARRNRYVAGLILGDTDRRAILPLIAEAPMYAKPHLSIWGEPFADERPLENMGVRHQGIAASLMPANPYACHNYALQLAGVGRREESYRWTDRATVAAPHLGVAHLDCVRRLRQLGRPGQAFAEAQYRCREILDRAEAGLVPSSDALAPHHAALLLAFVHLDVGRLAEAIELGDAALAALPRDAPTQDAFAWARTRIAHWKTDPGLLARAYAWEGHHRGDPGRVIAGFARGRLTDDGDAMMLIEALLATGRPDEAELAYWQCAGLDGSGVLGDGKARLAAARALILAGDLEEALEQIQIVQLRRGASRLEAEINRVLRLAAIRPAAAWERALARRLDLGAPTLARMAARDLADFVPGLDAAIARRALGEPAALAIDPAWIDALVTALPAARATASAIRTRLARPAQATLAAADALAGDWSSVLVPPARDRDAHAAGALLALGVALASYLEACSGAPSPIAGAYRQIATEALHLVRRARYQLDAGAIEALLRLVDRLGGAPAWLLDTWLLRIERALDLEAEHGAYLDGLIAGMPTVQRLLRGDERIGWELRLAHDLAADPSQYEPAAHVFERSARAVEAGATYLAWSTAAAAGAPPAAQLDIHWLAALANPAGCARPWIRVARGLMSAGRPGDGFLAACRGAAAATAHERDDLLDELAFAWKAARVPTPFDGDAALEAGLAAAASAQLPVAVQHLRWAAAIEPSSAERALGLASALARAGRMHEALRVLSAHEPADAPRRVGRLLAEAGHHADAATVLRYASRRFRAGDDWACLARAASRADDDALAAEAGRHALELGIDEPAFVVTVATSLYRIGEWVACEELAQRLIGDRQRDVRLAGLHAMARALAGQGRHVDAHRYAKAAAELQPSGELEAELRETMDRIVAQQTPATRPNADASMERRACRDLEAGAFDALVPAITSPSWGVARAALCACEFRTDDENGIPVAPRALDAAAAILRRTEGETTPDAVLARIRALKIRDNAFIQIDPPPPLGLRYTEDELARAYAERERRVAR